jgi:hypothetical protein
MNLSVVIFNYNYHRFLNKLFDSLSYAFNHKQINIFFCDDGSSDDSLSFVYNYIEKYDICNLIIIKVSNVEDKREYPSGGQLEGIKKIIDNHNADLYDYISFIDSDDWFDTFSVENILDEINHNNFKIYLNDLRDAKSYTDLPFEKQPTKRKISNTIHKIWPTIVPTSGIVIQKEILIENIDKLINSDRCFCDVWLDSRINMLAINYKDNVKYTNIIVYRYMHGENDSLKFDLKRKLQKQIQASKYFNYIVKVKLEFNIRKKILEIIHG